MKLSSFRFQAKRESWNGLNEERERETIRRNGRQRNDGDSLEEDSPTQSSVQEENRMYHLNGVGTNEESGLKNKTENRKVNENSGNVCNVYESLS